MNPEQGKFLCKVFCDTIQMEFETTKKVIRAVPDDKKSYKPEAKSMSAHELAWHIASAEMFFLYGVINGKFETGGEQPAAPATIGEILQWYESNHKNRMAQLQNLAADKVVRPVQFHGTASYLLDSTYDDAITNNTQALSADVQRRGHPLPGTEQWFAGTFGGPISRDRTFFFGSYRNGARTRKARIR